MISASLQQRKTRTRRSMLFVPGANAAMVSNSFIYPADALMFDLEDSVALREKDTARRMVYHALQHPLYRDIEPLCVSTRWIPNGVLTTWKPSFAVVRTLCVCRKPIPLRMFWILKKRSCVSKKPVS
ncbi:citrate lyase subunit beta [Escherichia coli]|uniref:Citrate lyase subunit beta n=1 Tax=Escherichia coli TaxID=562 RepID=A0A377E722_ECOLX|nr:citrate lyase subunit beta [Escherichia coli]